MDDEVREKLRVAGRVAREAKELGVSLCRDGTSLLDIAERIEAHMRSRGAPPAFPLASVSANSFLTNLTTSAYPGQCTNFGAGTEADFLPLGPATDLPTSATTSAVSVSPARSVTRRVMA